MIIDAHAHVGPWFFAQDTVSGEVNDLVMDRYGIDLQLVSHTEAVTYDPVAGNRALAELLPRHPRLRGMVTIDPRELDSSRADLERYLARDDFVGIKLHEHYTATPLSDPLALGALRLAAEFGVPLLAHTWGTSLLDLAHATAQVDGLVTIAGHMGGPDWHLAPQAAEICDRLILEFCYSVPDRGRIAWVLDRVDPRRVVFGTDATLIDPAVALGSVRAANLDNATAELVMWRNAARIFQLRDSAGIPIDAVAP